MLAALRRALPFLDDLPPVLLHALDTSTLLVPEGNLQALRLQLERALDCHVMTYRAAPTHAQGGGLHLCRLLVPAVLSAQQLETLRTAEAACGDGVVLVAYGRPLRLHTP